MRYKVKCDFCKKNFEIDESEIRKSKEFSLITCPNCSRAVILADKHGFLENVERIGV